MAHWSFVHKSLEKIEKLLKKFVIHHIVEPLLTFIFPTKKRINSNQDRNSWNEASSDDDELDEEDSLSSEEKTLIPSQMRTLCQSQLKDHLRRNQMLSPIII